VTHQDREKAGVIIPIFWKKEQDHGTERGEIGVEAKRSIGRSFNLHLLDKKRAEEGVLVVLDSGHSDRALGTKGLNRNASEVSGKKEKEGERGGEGKGMNHAAKWASWKYRRRYGRSLGARGGTWGRPDDENKTELRVVTSEGLEERENIGMGIISGVAASQHQKERGVDARRHGAESRGVGWTWKSPQFASSVRCQNDSGQSLSRDRGVPKECLKKERGEAEKREDREEQEYSVG